MKKLLLIFGLISFYGHSQDFGIGLGNGDALFKIVSQVKTSEAVKKTKAEIEEKYSVTCDGQERASSIFPLFNPVVNYSVQCHDDETSEEVLKLNVKVKFQSVKDAGAVFVLKKYSIKFYNETL